jgi:hypothetical protein
MEMRRWVRLGLVAGIASISLGGSARAQGECFDPFYPAPRPGCQWQATGCFWNCPEYSGSEVTVSVVTPPTQAGSVNLNLTAGCGNCNLRVPISGSETAAQHCEELVQAIKGSACTQGFVVAADQCGLPGADFAVSCGLSLMTLGISTASVFTQFDQTYLGPLSDGESDNIVPGPPPASASVPALSTWFVAGAVLALAAAGPFGLGRARRSANALASAK